MHGMYVKKKSQVSNVVKYVSKKYLMSRYVIRAICFTDQIYNHYSIHAVLLILNFKVRASSVFPFVNGGHTLHARMNLHFVKTADMVKPHSTTMLITTTFLNQK
jgi:hypothetical protein